MRSRWTDLTELTVRELVTIVLVLEAELAREQRRGALCGNICGAHSCQLAEGHEGLHAWKEPAGDMLVRWGG